jgi:hypothetical protein
LENANKDDWTLNLGKSNIIVYIRENSMSSLNLRESNAPGPTDEGFTVYYTTGVIAEVFAEGNMIPRQFANMIFHEIMHAKLDIGQTVVPYKNSDPPERRGIHNIALGGGGLAAPRRVDGETLTPKNKQLMSAHILDPVSMNTKYL